MGSGSLHFLHMIRLFYVDVSLTDTANVNVLLGDAAFNALLISDFLHVDYKIPYMLLNLFNSCLQIQQSPPLSRAIWLCSPRQWFSQLLPVL